MPTIVDRDLLVGLLAEEFAAVVELGGALDDAQWAEPTCLPGWSVKDQLSHMAGTERMLAGEPPPNVDISHADWLRNDIARANEVWVEANRPLSGADIVAQFGEVTQRRLEALDAMTQADFDAPSWTPAGRDETYGRFMRIRHYDCFLHEHDMRQALGFPDRDSAAHVRSAVDEVSAALGFIVGRRAGLPAETSVRIDLTGAGEATFLVEVGERAQVVASHDGPVTTGLRLPAMLFLRLTGGRVEASGYLGSSIEIEGDAALGRQLATNLSFTI